MVHEAVEDPSPAMPAGLRRSSLHHRLRLYWTIHPLPLRRRRQGGYGPAPAASHRQSTQAVHMLESIRAVTLGLVRQVSLGWMRWPQASTLRDLERNLKDNKQTISRRFCLRIGMSLSTTLSFPSFRTVEQSSAASYWTSTHAIQSSRLQLMPKRLVFVKWRGYCENVQAVSNRWQSK